MTKFFFLFFLCLIFINGLFAQAITDSGGIKKDSPLLHKIISAKDTIIQPAVLKTDSLQVKRDSIITIDKADSLHSHSKASDMRNSVPIFRSALLQNPYFNFLGKIQLQDIRLHKADSSDALFYLVFGMCFYFALIKLFFGKYVYNLLSLFFRASMRQQQMREQAQQTPLPSLLLNILFILTSGLYTCFIMRYYKFVTRIDFWLLLVYCIIIIGAIYFARFCVLKLCGWIFNIPKVTDNYIFVIFLINKIAGFALLPFLTLISFSDPFISEMAITVSMMMIAGLFLYRFAACYATVRSEIKLSMFHYFIYLCAFEIAPLLLIYKVALTYLKKAY